MIEPPNFEPMPRCGPFREFLAFAKEEKKWWLIPLLVVGALVALAMAAGQNPLFAPFVYPLF